MHVYLGGDHAGFELQQATIAVAATALLLVTRWNDIG